MAAAAANNPNVAMDENGCPLPPMDHLKPGMSSVQAAAVAAAASGTFDRVGGNPGPEVTPFGSSIDNPPPPSENEPNADSTASESKSKDGKEKVQISNAGDTKKAKDDEIRRSAVTQLVEVLPHIAEGWLEKCVDARIIADKWNLERTASWIFDYDNFAPRKEIKRKFVGDFSRYNDYDSIKTMLKNVKQESPSQEYMFYSSLKLSHKFPQFSMYSLRQILVDLANSYSAAVFAIVEGLEEVMNKDGKTWKDWALHELIEIKVKREEKWYLYPLCVVKGVKTWSKKKARMTPMPEALAQEIRLVEKALYFYEKRYRALKSKLDAERIRSAQLKMAIENGHAIECPICSEDYLQEEQVNCTADHEFCVSCLSRSVDEALIGQVKITPEGNLPCLNAECEGVFTLRMLCHVLSGEQMNRLEESIWRDFLARADIPNLCTCFACGYAEQIEVPLGHMRIFQCRNPKCRRKWCRECRSLWDTHIGKSCKEMAGDPEEAIRKKYDDLMSDVVIRTCRCGRPLQKDGGCNKMTCQCGAKMCYLCRQPIASYDHFCQHPTNPGQVCSICTGCRLWEDPQKIDDTLRAKLQLQLQEELFELKLAYVGKSPGKQSAAAPKQPEPGAPVAPEQRQFAAMFG